MNAADAFIAAIRARPADDVPRLIYADYLDERGNPLGQFIRSQINSAKLCDDDPWKDELRTLESQILSEHEAEWLGPLADELARWWFHRGFLEVSVDVRRFLSPDAKWIDWPMVVGIHLYPPTYMEVETIIELTRSPRAERVRSIYLGYEWVRDVGARAIAESQYFQHVSAIDLTTNGVTDVGVAALGATNHLPSLRVLSLGNNLITDAGAASLAASPNRSGLRQLDLSHNEITTVGAAALAASPHLGRLASLKLFGNRFDGRSRGGKALKKRFANLVSWRSI